MTNQTSTKTLSTLILAADKNGRRAVATKIAVACMLVAENMEQGTTQGHAIDLYAVPANQRTKEAKEKSTLFQAARGFNRFYLKPVSDARQFMTTFFANVQKLDLTGSFATVADRILDADIWGPNGAPSTMKEFQEFIGEYAPATKTGKPAKQDDSKPASGKSKDGGKDATNADTNVNNAVSALLAKVQDHTQALINAQLEALDKAGLPKAHRAKVSKAMLALASEMRKDIEKQAQK